MSRLNNSISPIRDPQVIRVLESMNNERKHPPQELFREAPVLDPEKFSGYGFSIAPEQGELIYLLCRAMKATRVVDFATSVGMSALYFAAAMKDNGGGLVIGSEMVREKAEVASRNLAEAGLTSFVDIRVGDARETLKDLGGPVDFILIDGFPLADGPSLARQVTEIVAPQLRVGGYILNDNAEPDFLSYVRDPQNGFISITLPIKRGTELALKIS
ncbi:O-methyltransferase [Escherichia coli]|uniref:O-methyltransferase n=1 Tax=Escherichia coli TaxID=562 RepID=UPI000BE1E7F4|nr:class I SAM-dependent methyltransferase [Escherichia coli]CAD5778523.1 Predicted O-methyltransferase [Escherichia coli]CAD5794029.1 Predicted O-methyltransferase [Escherichia coli]